MVGMPSRNFSRVAHKNGSRDHNHAPFSVHLSSVGLVKISVYHKFEVPIFTRYGNTQVNENI